MNVLVFGATGSAGASVLRTCLSVRAVREVRAITRRALAVRDARLESFLHTDYLNYDAVGEAFDGLDACFFCLGVSATKVSEESAYRTITRDFAVAAAETLRARSPSARFHFISGTGTRADSRFMWARVKAQAERDLIACCGAVCWRPGFIDGEPSSTDAWYHGVLRPVFRLLKPFPGLYVAGDDVGRAMLQATREGMNSRIIENAEIRQIAARYVEPNPAEALS